MDEQPKAKPRLPLSSSSSGSVAGVSAEFSMMEDLNEFSGALEKAAHDLGYIAKVQVEEAAQEFAKTASEASRLLEAAAKNLSSPVTGLNEAMIGMAKNNYEEGLRLWQRLMTASGPADALQAQSDYVQNQMMRFQEQMEQLRFASESIFNASMEPFKAEAAKNIQRFRLC